MVKLKAVWIENGFILIIKFNNMNDFKTRLVQEQVELKERLSKLDNFLMSEKVRDVTDVQKALLQVQATAMNTYLQCLKERIERL